MGLFDAADTFIGMSDHKFDDKLQVMSTKDLESLYLKAKDAYYDGNPIMSDPQFDRLEDKLKSLGSKITSRVGGGSDADDTGTSLLVHKHLSPMLSLDKIQVNDENKFPLSDIVDFFKWSENYELESTPKYDGNAYELEYNGGLLVRAITRGKGGKGADVTDKMKLIVPTVITSKLHLEVRGEVVIPVDIFNKKYLKDKGTVDGRYANPRNMIGGVFNPKNSIEDHKIKDCFFVAYSLKAIQDDGSFRYVSDAMDNLGKLGFNAKYQVPVFKIKKKLDIIAAYDFFKKYRANGQFALDGFVIKMPESMRLNAGETSHHPRWATAVKFPSKTATTSIIGVEWAVGYTGELSPVGLLEPVDLDGSMVSRVSLYNKTKMEQGGTFIGAIVTIKKSGDIIPQIIKIEQASPDASKYINAQDFYPKCCPSCNGPLVIKREKVTEHLLCENHKCPAQKARKLASGLSALGLKGVGESTCTDLFKSGVEDIFDFFDEDKMNSKVLCSTGILKPGRQLDIILALPNKLKQVDLDKMILSLQFDNLGDTGSKQVARMFAKVPYSFNGLEQAVVDPFLNPNSMQTLLVKKLKGLLEGRGVSIVMPLHDANAITFEMTGSPKGTDFDTKEELVAYLKTKGYAHTKLKDAKILLTESYSSNSTKMKDAQKKGIKILTYEDLIKSL